MKPSWAEKLKMTKDVFLFWLFVGLVGAVANGALALVCTFCASKAYELPPLSTLIWIFVGGSLGICLGAGCLLWIYLLVTKRNAPEVMQHFFHDLAKDLKNL
jgi:hypothetical protein